MAVADVRAGTHSAVFSRWEIGARMLRRFMTKFRAALTCRSAGPSPGVRGTVCTGKVFHPYLKRCVDRLGMDLKTVAVESRFWGSGIGVAGLLTGSDFIAALKDNVYGDFVVLPSESMIGDDHLFLDDLTIKDVERELGVEVVPSGYDARDFVRELLSRQLRELHKSLA